MGVIRGGEEAERFVWHPFLPLPVLGLSQVEQYLLQQCHKECPFEILVGDPYFSISCVLSSCGVGHHGAFPEEDWTGCLGAWHLFFNQEADHDPADHKTGRQQCLHSQVQSLIFHKIVEGALTRDHDFCLQIPVCQAQIRLGDR